MLSVVYISSRDAQEARLLARTLVEERLVACVNSWPISSTFRWEGRVEEGQEVALLCKTQSSLVPAVLKRAKELHSYEVPCITAWPIGTGNPDYLDWVGRETG